MTETQTTAPATELDRALPAIVIHTALRREVGRAGPLVWGVADGDTARAATVAEHLRVVLHLLHHHHENEDELVFPLLAQRATGEEPGLVELMEGQHAELVRLLAVVEATLPRWRDGAARVEREVLAAALEDLHRVLVEHLEVEERAVLPVAERVLTDEEWVAISEHGEKGAEGKDKLLVFGMLVHEGDPAVIATMLASAPAPVRVLLPRLARRAYRKHAAKVYGTSTP